MDAQDVMQAVELVKRDIFTRESSDSYRHCFKNLRVDRGFFIAIRL